VIVSGTVDLDGPVLMIVIAVHNDFHCFHVNAPMQ
jgi:hypothetical protein